MRAGCAAGSGDGVDVLSVAVLWLKNGVSYPKIGITLEFFFRYVKVSYYALVHNMV